MIKGHGNNIYEYENLIRHDFSSNVAFNNKSAELVEFLKAKVGSVRNYPDPEAKALTEKIAEHHGTDPRGVLVTNGSAEAFYLIAHLLQGTKSAICIPSFAEYEDACTLYKHDCIYIPITQFKEVDLSLYGSVWLGNPNNPDGTLTLAGDISRQCKKTSETIFIIDYAYLGLTSRKEEIEITRKQPDNLIQIHSLTKLFGVPGIRLGYLIASPCLIDQISSMRTPWSVNSMALCAGEYIIDNYKQLLPDLTTLTSESIFLQERLSENTFIEIVPSSCNFFLSRLQTGTAEWLKGKLINNYGLLIRNASNFRGLDDTYFRISAQNHFVNQDLINAVNILLNEL